LQGHSLYGRDYLDAATTRLVDLAGESPCDVPIAGGTARVPAALETSAAYDFAVSVPRKGATLGPSLRGVTFTTSRYRNPREQMSALGFGTAGLLGAGLTRLEGGLPASTQLLPLLAGMPTALTEDSDASFAAALSDAGLPDWASDDGLARTSVLWVDVEGVWNVVGILLESPEPLHRPHRLWLGSLTSAAVTFEIRRGDSAGIRQLFLSRNPFVPVGQQFMGITVPTTVDLTVDEHPDAKPTDSPAPSSFVVSATLPRVPAFAEEL